MKIFNNQGELTGEISTGFTQNGDRITSNTLYDRGNPVMQNVTIRQSDGTVHTENIIGRKILP
ncbi:MAG: hypothetical protein ABSG23_12120 [Terriglobales bacterium]|jgi:hypothetical protein